MITMVEYQNFKILKDVQCGLTRLTVIVGPNACGKTSILQGMWLLSQLSQHSSPQDVLAIFSHSQSLELMHSGDGNSQMQLSCTGDVANEGFDFAASRMEGKVNREKLLTSGWFGGVSLTSRSSSQNPMISLSRSNSCTADISALSFLRFESRILAQPSYSNEVDPLLASSGEGLATVLASMKLSQPEVFEEVQGRLRQIVPHFHRLRFRRVKMNRDESEIIRIGEEAITRKVTREYPADMLIFDFEHRQDIPATNVSEGTMLALGLLTVLHSSLRPRVVLLDDIEKGLHPNAQRELIGMLRDILRDQPDLQIVATSHSPYFLDFLDPSEVRLMAIGADGFSRCGMLTDHPEFEKWKDEMTPGEMWSFFGEKWLVEEKV